MLTLEQHLGTLQLEGNSAAPVPASPIRSIQNEVTHAARLARSELDRDRPALADADGGKAIQLNCVDDGAEVANPGFERQIVDVSIRQSTSSRVVANQSVARRQRFEPRSPGN